MGEVINIFDYKDFHDPVCASIDVIAEHDVALPYRLIDTIMALDPQSEEEELFDIVEQYQKSVMAGIPAESAERQAFKQIQRYLADIS